MCNGIWAIESHSFQQLEGDFPGAILGLVEGGGGIHVEFGLAVDDQGSGGRLFTDGTGAIIIPGRVGTGEAAGAFADVTVIVGRVFDHDQVVGIVLCCIAVHQAASGGSIIIVLGESCATGEVPIYTACAGTGLDAIEQNYALVQNHLAALDVNRIVTAASALENDARGNSQRAAGQVKRVTTRAGYLADAGGAGDGHVAALDLEGHPVLCLHMLPVQVDGDITIDGYGFLKLAVPDDFDRSNRAISSCVHCFLDGFIIGFAHHGHLALRGCVGIRLAAVAAPISIIARIKGVVGAGGNGVGGAAIPISNGTQPGSPSFIRVQGHRLLIFVLEAAAVRQEGRHGRVAIESAQCHTGPDGVVADFCFVIHYHQVLHVSIGDTHLFCFCYRDGVVVDTAIDDQGHAAALLAENLALHPASAVHRQGGVFAGQNAARAIFVVQQGVAVQVDGQGRAGLLLVVVGRYAPSRHGVAQQIHGVARSSRRVQGLGEVRIISSVYLCHRVGLTAVVTGRLGGVRVIGMGGALADGQGLVSFCAKRSEIDRGAILFKAVAIGKAVLEFTFAERKAMEGTAAEGYAGGAVEIQQIHEFAAGDIQRLGSRT